jgi:hypothetical protein
MKDISATEKTAINITDLRKMPEPGNIIKNMLSMMYATPSAASNMPNLLGMNSGKSGLSF